MPSSQPRGGPGGSLRKGLAGKVPPGSIGGKTILRGSKRHRKIAKDTIHGITRPAIRRLARRGGVKRISMTIYNDVREALKSRLEMILKDCVAFVEYRRAKTVTVLDVLHSLKRIGRPVYGFDPDTYVPPSRRAQRSDIAPDEE